MIPGKSLFFACPVCNFQHSFPGWISRTVHHADLKSDLSRHRYSPAPDIPDYAECQSCGAVRPIGDYKNISRLDPKLPAAIKMPSIDRLKLALGEEPFRSEFTYGLNLRLWLLRGDNNRIDAGIPARVPAWRDELLHAFYSQCESLATTPVWAHLTIEVERYLGLFEPAAQRARNVMCSSKDPMVRFWAEQEFQWCKQQSRTRQKLAMPASAIQSVTSFDIRKRTGLKYLLVATGNQEVDSKVGKWTDFPDGLALVEKLSSLSAMARMLDPLGGIVLASREVWLTYPDTNLLDAFLESGLNFVKDIPILLVTDPVCGDDYNRKLKDVLRSAGFHLAVIEVSKFDFERFTRWKLTHSRRGAMRVRSVLKFQRES